MSDGSGSPAILMKIQLLAKDASKSERRVLNYIVDNPSDVISLSVAGLAEKSGVSDATVIRTCKTIGFGSYQEFKVTLAQDIVSPLQSIHEEVQPGDTSEAILDKVFRGNMFALEYTRSVINCENIERAAEALISAKRVLIFGLGNSHSVAQDLQHKLMRLGINAYHYLDSHIQAIAAANATYGDVVFAISHSGSSIDVVDSAKLCKDRNALIISLTNIGKSPLGVLADIPLYTASKETTYRIVALSSRIAQTTIIDCLYTLIACHHTEVTNNFREVEKALEKKKY